MKNKLLKKSLLLLTAASITLGVVGCGSSTSKAGNESTKVVTDAKTDAKAENIKLRVMWWGSQARHDATQKALDLYTEKNPHVTFEAEYLGFDGYWDKLSTQAAAGNAPDIIQMDTAYLNDYASRNILADISEGINTSDMDAALLETGVVNGKLYALPSGSTTIAMPYNRALLESLGVELPKDGWTWDDYFTFGKELKSKVAPGQYPLYDVTLGIGAFPIYSMYQLANGKGHPYTPDGKTNIDKDTWTQWMTIHKELRKEGIVPPAEIMVTEKDDAQSDLLVNGTVFIKTAASSQMSSFDGFNPGAYDMVTMPRAQESGGWLKASMFWSLSKDSKHIEEAKKVVDWLINDPEAGEILGVTRGLPVSSKIVEQLEPTFTDADKIAINVIKNTAPDAQVFVPEPKGWSNFPIKDYKDIAEKVAFENLTIEEGYEALLKAIKDYEENAN